MTLGDLLMNQMRGQNRSPGAAPPTARISPLHTPAPHLFPMMPGGAGVPPTRGPSQVGGFLPQIPFRKPVPKGPGDVVGDIPGNIARGPAGNNMEDIVRELLMRLLGGGGGGMSGGGYYKPEGGGY